MQEIFGREDELASLRAYLEKTPCAVVLEGEAGIGKSTLWLAGLDHARARGCQVLESRPAEAEVGLAYVGLGDLFEDVIDGLLPALTPPRRRALEVALLREESAGDSVDTRAIGVAIRDVLEQLAAPNPLLIAIDDIQWFDESSSRSLAFALHRLKEQNISFLATRRISKDTRSSEIERALDPARLDRMTVGSLSVGAAHKFLQDRLHRAFPRPTLLRLHETSGGNPFYLLELARAVDLDSSATLERLVGSRLKGLPRKTRDALLAVATHGRPSVDLFPARALRPAFDAGIIEHEDGAIRFSHPLLASAVYEGASTLDRRHAHRRVAATIDDPISRARHLALAADRPSADIANTLDEAGASAFRRGAAVAAAELAELAVRLTPPELDDQLRERLWKQADYLCVAGDGRRAIALLGKTVDTAPAGRVRAQALARVARVEREFVGAREGVITYRKALAEAEGDDALLAEIHVSLADLLRDTEDARLALTHAGLAVDSAERNGDPALRCDALAMYSLIHSRIGLGIPQERMQAALELERSLPASQRTNVATHAQVYQLIWCGELGKARDLIEEWRSRIAQTNPREEELALWYAAMLEWRAGNWALAAQHAADSLSIREEFGMEGSQPVAEVPAAMVAAYRGKVDEARERSTRALSRAEADGIFIAQSAHRAVLGFIELSLGEPARALGYLRRGWEIRDAAVLMEPGHRWELADTLEALIAVGDLDEADQKLAVWEERAQRLDRAWALAITSRCRALVVAAQGDLAGASSHFERALAQHLRVEDPFQHARTLLAQGTTQRRAMQRAAARTSLAQALELFEKVGSPLWAEKARAELKRIGGRASATDELTESERRVAALVAQGRTNYEVASALFLGERTVASHLTHIYAKLGIRSRTELARRLQ